MGEEEENSAMYCRGIQVSFINIFDFVLKGFVDIRETATEQLREGCSIAMSFMWFSSNAINLTDLL